MCLGYHEHVNGSRGIKILKSKHVFVFKNRESHVAKGTDDEVTIPLVDPQLLIREVQTEDVAEEKNIQEDTDGEEN